MVVFAVASLGLGERAFEHVAETIAIGIAILDDEGLDGVGPREGEAQAHWGAIVEDVHAEGRDGEGIEELSEGKGEVHEGIFVVCGRTCKAESGEIRGDDVILLREDGHQIAEHVG